METAVQLHQFTEVPFALPSLAMFLALPLPAPQTRCQHPTAQSLVIHHNAVFLGQVLGRQRRPEFLPIRTSLFLMDLPQQTPSKPQALIATRRRPGGPMFEPER